jgi:hypothetical protein
MDPRIEKKKKWNSLSDLKDFIEKNIPEEKVEAFNGFMLETNRYYYTLGPNGLNSVAR